MKKVIAILSAALFVASCSKEDTQNVGQSNAPQLTTDPEGKLEIVNEPFTIGKGKAAAQNYILRAVASAPVVNGVPTNCTSVKVNASSNKIYASWHTVDGPHGGAISGYDYNLSAPDETILQFTGELRFPTVDFHEMALNVAGDRIYYVGQRDKNDGTYNDAAYNNNGGWHGGAVAGYVNLDGSQNLGITFDETALYGFAGNAIVRHNAGATSNTFDVITGEGQGNIIRLEEDLTREGDSVGIADGEYLLKVGPEIFGFQGETGTTADSKMFKYNKSSIDKTNALTLSSINNTTDLDKNAMAEYNGDVLVANGDGITLVDNANSTESSIVSGIGGESRGLATDASNNLVYLANGEGGLYAIDGTNINSPSIIGTWQGPTTASSFDVKDVYTATDGGDRFVFVADASGTLYIIEKL